MFEFGKPLRNSFSSRRHIPLRRLVFFLGMISVFIILMFYLYFSSFDDRTQKTEDQILKELIQKDLGKFYYFPRDKWYNREKVSQLDKELVREVRENWIIEKPDNLDQNYFLESPEVKDPSMGQAEVIRKIFNYSRNGFFIECGAYDGETRSNTLNLERYYGWTGILIEADPKNFLNMTWKHRKAYMSPTCLAITPYPQISSFLMANNVGRLHEPISSSDVNYKNSPDVAHFGQHIDVQCFPLATYIFALNRTSVDYFSLDVEGNEMDVLETIPFDSVDIKTLSVEHIHDKKGSEYMIDFMKNKGYYAHSYVERRDNLANDVIFVKESFIPSTEFES